jgi:uncharacterized protein
MTIPRKALALLVLAVFAAACGRLRRGPKNEAPPAPASASASAAAAARPSASASGGAPVSLDGFVRMTVTGVAQTGHGSAVLLVDDEHKRGVPIFVGETEALSIRLRLAKQRYARPLTHDLMDSALGELGASIEYVRVDKLQDNVFFGTIVVRDGARRIELDARSSDAVAMALGQQVPIFVARKVLDASAVDLDKLGKPADGGPEPEHDPRRPDPIAL